MKGKGVVQQRFQVAVMCITGDVSLSPENLLRREHAARMSEVSVLEKTTFLLGLLCLCTGSADAAALGVYQSPPCIFAAVGSEPIMECRFPPMEASEAAFISWYKEERKLSPSDRRFRPSQNLTAGSASLRIPHMQAQDAGVYTCEVGNWAHSSTGNGTKLKVHGSGQKLENQTAAAGCAHFTAPQQEHMALIVGLPLLFLLTASVLIICYFKRPKWFPAEESFRRQLNTHRETPTQQELTTDVPPDLYHMPKSTSRLAHQKERQLQPQTPANPIEDGLNYSSMYFSQEYPEAVQMDEERTELYAPVKKKKSSASYAAY
ncbi:uncharacterized protein LOC123349510 [Mauremys mutica]|uniref:uncharacterized protein LOC123349510 n=1 Tax=Mauremys mutica TaxID=74926 RepID=UPI001D15EFBA|nr:uncharacterized protein LOC123349510 [Mauremys mutica]